MVRLRVSKMMTAGAMALVLASLPCAAAEWALTTGTDWNDDPEWCGDFIVLRSDRDPSVDNDIWFIEVDGTGQVDEFIWVARDALHDDRAPTWEYGPSQCGFYLFFERQLAGGNTEIRGMTSSGSASILATLGAHEDRAPDRSSGRMLVYSDRNGNDDIIWIDGGGETYGSGNLTTNPADDRYPCWSYDEDWIAFASDRSGNWDIWVMSAAGEGDTLRQLTDTVEDESLPAWSPTGEYIAFAREGVGIVAADAWGRAEYQVTTGATDSSPTWSDDASMLAFSRQGGGGCNIWVTDNLPQSPVEYGTWGRLKAMYR